GADAVDCRSDLTLESDSRSFFRLRHGAAVFVPGLLQQLVCALVFGQKLCPFFLPFCGCLLQTFLRLFVLRTLSSQFIPGSFSRSGRLLVETGLELFGDQSASISLCLFRGRLQAVRSLLLNRRFHFVNGLLYALL